MTPLPEGDDYKWLPTVDPAWLRVWRRRWADFEDEYMDNFEALYGTFDLIGDGQDYSLTNIQSRLDAAAEYDLRDALDEGYIRSSVLLAAGWELELWSDSFPGQYLTLGYKEQIQIMMGAWVWNSFALYTMGQEALKLFYFHRTGRPREED